MESARLNGFSSYADLMNTFAGLGCDKVFVKRLSAKQDNDKNQIYLGKSLALIESLSPTKRNETVGKGNTKMGISLSWIDGRGNLHPAPHASIIFYSSYPESRLSGFMRECSQPLLPLSRLKMHEYGTRMLVMGVSPIGTYGTVITSRDNRDLLDELNEAYDSSGSKGVLKAIPLEENDVSIIARLASVLDKEHPAVVLKNREQGPTPHRCPQGAGYTLESLLLVCQNGISGPDLLGVEVKTVSAAGQGNAKLTLATTEPDLGYKALHGTRPFVGLYGKCSVKYPDRQVLNGVHRINKTNLKTGLRLEILNWDFVKNKRLSKDLEPQIILRDVRTGRIVAGWSYNKMKESWEKKHNRSVYVPYTGIRKDDGKYPSHYRYEGQIIEGEGTDVDLFFARVADGTIVWDPAYEIKDGKVSSRSQWRLGGGTRLKPLKGETFSEQNPPPIVKTLSGLYKTTRLYDLNIQEEPLIIITSE